MRTTQRRVAIGRDRQRIEAGGFGDRGHFRPGPQEGVPPDRSVKGIHGVFAGIDRLGERINGPAEDQHEPRHVLRCGGVAACLGVLRAGEDAADQLVRHL